nr:hypothetical protein [Tanacetum cinerariifolium]GEX34370.1 hypothetical protein [Tanacetum cinerariifolium]
KGGKEDLRKQYAECKDISPKRRALIDRFLEDEAMKDYEVKSTLWKFIEVLLEEGDFTLRWQTNNVVFAFTTPLLRWLSGANNDLNVLCQSNLFDEVRDDAAPECPFTVKGSRNAKKDFERAFGVLRGRWRIVS